MKKTKEELYKWFWKKFDSCYLVEHEDEKGNYYMFYDEQFLRQKKLTRILDSDEEIIYPTKPSGKVLFYQDWKNEHLWCDYKEIWTYLETNYIDNYNEIKDLIICMLVEHDKLSVLTTINNYACTWAKLVEHDKLSVLTDTMPRMNFKNMLEEHDKLSVLTTGSNLISLNVVLEEHDKLSVFTRI